jgi:5'-nucleotidase
MLEQQFCGINASLNRVLQPSAGFTYTWNGAAAGAADCASADAVDPATIAIGGVPVDPGGTYRITVNSFLATGGDGFAVLNSGTDRLGGAVDLDAPGGLLRREPERGLARPPRPHHPGELTVRCSPGGRSPAPRAAHGTRPAGS